MIAWGADLLEEALRDEQANVSCVAATGDGGRIRAIGLFPEA